MPTTKIRQQSSVDIQPAGLISNFDLHLFAEGKHRDAYNFLGANPRIIEGHKGILFAVWAPNANSVCVVGDFNNWITGTDPMSSNGDSGVWEVFVPNVAVGALYKFVIRSNKNGHTTERWKSDPYAKAGQLRPETASIVCADSLYQWQDSSWLQQRAKANWGQQPFSVYEVHLGSWQRDEHHGFLNYRELAHRLVEHVMPLGFTHIELMPISEHPFDGSWGYQTTGYYAPTARFGSPDDLRYFIDYCHQHGLGVLLDWVPAHFPKDEHGLAQYDGTALYEHLDSRQAEHKEWGTLVYNYARHEVKNFLIANALYWLKEFHFDGLRVDAVASMLYLDYSREDGDWLANQHGGNENLEAVAFLREFNQAIHESHPGALTIAEESTAWPGVTRSIELGGLGFSMKWNLGWMNDSLEYASKAPVYRRYHHELLSFPALYAHHENFLLPYSHDEVVHGKRSLRYKMPGDEWQQVANQRLLYTYLYTWPGKKLLFMGNEFGQGSEWNHDESLEWDLLQYPLHLGLQSLFGDVNCLYRDERALHQHDFAHHGFEWLDCHDSDQSVISYIRHADDRFVIVVLNFTPIVRENYRLGVPSPGTYFERLNSDSSNYGGSNVGNLGEVHSDPIAWMNQANSIEITLPPLAGLIFSL